MNVRIFSKVLASTAVMAVLAGAASPGHAQAAKTAPAKMPEHDMKDMKDRKDMKGMTGKNGMKGMMDGPHQVLAMAYRDNLMTFGRALKGDLAKSKTTVDVDVARPATAEMRRSFDHMRQHHQAHSSMMGSNANATMMGSSANATMMGKMKDMDAHLATLDHHLVALESEVKAGTPDPKKVSEHLREVLKHCEGMAAMHAKAKSHQMK